MIKFQVQSAITCFRTACEYRRAEMALLLDKSDEIPTELKASIEELFSQKCSTYQVVTICALVAIRFQDSGIAMLKEVATLKADYNLALAQAIVEFNMASKYRRADQYHEVYELENPELQDEDPEEEISLTKKKELFGKATIHQQAGILILLKIVNNLSGEENLKSEPVSEIMA